MTKNHISWPIEWEQVERKIRLIPQYAQKAASIQIEAWSLELLKPMCLYVRLHRLNHVRRLVRIYNEYRIPLFEPIKKEDHIICPPIIEIHDDSAVIIDGLHRIYLLRNMKIKDAKLIIIRGVNSNLPADVIDWPEIHSTTKILSRAEKFRNFNEQDFREINKYIDEFD